MTINIAVTMICFMLNLPVSDLCSEFMKNHIPHRFITAVDIRSGCMQVTACRDYMVMAAPYTVSGTLLIRDVPS